MPEQLPLSMCWPSSSPSWKTRSTEKIGQNLKYDWSVLYELGLKPSGIGADTMVAAYVLDPCGRHNLDTIWRAILDYKVMTYEDVCGKGKDQLCFDQIPIDVATRYSAEDAWIAVKLWHELKSQLERMGLWRSLRAWTCPLVEVLAKMESQGVCIDVHWLRKLSTEFGAELKSIEERIAAFTKGPVNLNSPKQLGAASFEDLKLPPQSKTKTGYSTDASVLEALAPLARSPALTTGVSRDFQAPGHLRRSLAGAAGSERRKDPRKFSSDGGRHGTAFELGSQSCKTSRSNPSGAATSGARLFRPKAMCFSPADYSQIELRLLAHMSGDQELVRSFQGRRGRPPSHGRRDLRH